MTVRNPEGGVEGKEGPEGPPGPGFELGQLGPWWGDQRYGNSAAAGANNRLYVVSLTVGGPSLITGLRYLVGNTANGNASAALYSADGLTQLAASAASVQPGVTAFHNLAWSGGPEELAAGLYLAALLFASTTATFRDGAPLRNSIITTNAGLPETVAVPNAAQTGAVPAISTYG